MPKQSLSGSWKEQYYVVSVPVASRASVRTILVHGAKAQLIQTNPAAFYVVIPASVPNADEWRVELDDKGALKVRPPKQQGPSTVKSVVKGNARVGIQAAVINGPVSMGRGRLPRVEPTIGLVLPRHIHIQDRL